MLVDPRGDTPLTYFKARPVPGDPETGGPALVQSVATPYGLLATAICFDLDFPDFIRQGGRSGADLLLAPSKDWRDIDPLHTRMAGLRAVENGFSLVRATYAGLSAAVDSQGRTLGAMDYFATEPRVFVSHVPMRGVRTVYGRIGDVFAWLCLAFLALAALAGAFNTRARPDIVGGGAQVRDISRRSFLRLGAAVAALSPASRARATPAADSSFDPWIEISAANLRHNLEQVRHRVAPRPILAVIKNNGYGLGVANVARILEPSAAVSGFAVVKLAEAVSLREAGIRKPVLLMGPFDETGLEEATARDIMPMVYRPIGDWLDRVAGRRGRPIPLHVCVDTGIGRVGVPHAQAASLVQDLVARPSMRLEGLMMTFTEDPAFDREQLRRFQALCASLEAAGVRVGKRHAASSFALFQHEDAFLDMVRPGMAIFGMYPEPQFRGTALLDLRPAVSLKARVIYVKPLRAGESAGYNRAYVAARDVWVATLPVGHADGLPRVAAKGGRVRIGDRLYPLIASVSASHSIVEVGAEPRVSVGDVATLFDDQEGSRPEDLAAACGSSVYDLTMHLNPLLPRRVL